MASLSADEARAAMKRKALDKGKQPMVAEKKAKLSGPPPGSALRRNLGVVIGPRRDPTPTQRGPTPAQRGPAPTREGRTPTQGPVTTQQDPGPTRRGPAPTQGKQAPPPREPTPARADAALARDGGDEGRSPDSDTVPLSVAIPAPGSRLKPSGAVPKPRSETVAVAGRAETPNVVAVPVRREEGAASPGRSTAGAWSETGAGWTFRARIGATDSGIHDAEVARALARGFLVPRDAVDTAALTIRELVDGPFCAIAKVVNHLAGMRSFILRHNEVRQQMERRAKGAEDGISQARGERDEARKEVSRLRDELAKSREGLAKERERAASCLIEKDEALKREADRNSQLKASLSQAETERREAERQRLTFEERASAAEQGAEAARERAAEAESLVAASERKAVAAEERRTAAEERAVAAESRAAAAEKQGPQAVEAYKLSSNFRDDAADLCVGFYSFGFQDCRKLVRESFPDLDLQHIMLEGEEEDGANGAEGPATEGGAEEEVETCCAPAAGTRDTPAAGCEPLPRGPQIAEGAPIVEVPPAAGTGDGGVAEGSLPSADSADAEGSAPSTAVPA